MKAADVTDMLDQTLEASECDRATVLNKPRLLTTMAQVLSPANWLIGWQTSRWITSEARGIIRGLKARSNAGTRP